MNPCLSGCERGRSGHLDLFTMRSMPSKSKLNRDVVNVTACVVPASQRRPAHAHGFGAAREPHITIAYAMSGTAVSGVRVPARARRFPASCPEPASPSRLSSKSRQRQCPCEKGDCPRLAGVCVRSAFYWLSRSSPVSATAALLRGSTPRRRLSEGPLIDATVSGRSRKQVEGRKMAVPRAPPSR